MNSDQMPSGVDLGRKGRVGPAKGCSRSGSSRSGKLLLLLLLQGRGGAACCPRPRPCPHPCPSPTSCPRPRPCPCFCPALVRTGRGAAATLTGLITVATAATTSVATTLVSPLANSRRSR